VGDEGKAVGRGPPTALLFEQGAQYKISKTKLSISMIAVTPATESTKASLASWWPANLSTFMGNDLATQYEIPFKLSISTFHVSVMAITPAIASHKVRHPSWWLSNFSATMASDFKNWLPWRSQKVCMSASP
jgi:hypothetical protein